MALNTVALVGGWRKVIDVTGQLWSATQPSWNQDPIGEVACARSLHPLRALVFRGLALAATWPRKPAGTRPTHRYGLSRIEFPTKPSPENASAKSRLDKDGIAQCRLGSTKNTRQEAFLNLPTLQPSSIPSCLWIANTSQQFVCVTQQLTAGLATPFPRQ